jgi:hypothetical protein
VALRGDGSLGWHATTADAARKIDGRELDISVDSEKQAKEFGERRGRVEVLDYGEGRRDARREPLPDPKSAAPAVTVAGTRPRP